MAAAMAAASTIERASPSPVSNRVAPSAGSRMSRVSQPARTTSAGEGRMKPGSPLRAAIRAQTATSTDSKASGGTDLATKVLRGRAVARRGRAGSRMPPACPRHLSTLPAAAAVTDLDPRDDLLGPTLPAGQVRFSPDLDHPIEGALHHRFHGVDLVGD